MKGASVFFELFSGDEHVIKSPVVFGSRLSGREDLWGGGAGTIPVLVSPPS